MSDDNKTLSFQDSPLTREVYAAFGRPDPEHKRRTSQFVDIGRLTRATSITIYGNDFSRRFVASDSGKMGIVDTRNGLVTNAIIILRDGQVRQAHLNLNGKRVREGLSPREIKEYGDYVRFIGDKVLPIAAQKIASATKQIEAVDQYDDDDLAHPGNLNAIRDVDNWFAANLKGNQTPPSPSG